MVDLPNNYDAEEFERIKAAAEKIRNQSDVFIVIGIGDHTRGKGCCRNAEPQFL